MATVYSLVCWGGVTGKSVTMTIASPCVVTSTDHGLRNGTRLVFSTTGALPTGVTAGTTYYAKSTAANTFNLYTDAALTNIVNTSGTQSGTHIAKSVLMLEYFDQYPTRWWDATLGVQRCYDGLTSWKIARSAKDAINEEVCELGQAFDDITKVSNSFSFAASSVRIESRIAGVRTEAFHNGVLGGGFIFKRTVSYDSGSTLNITSVRVTLDGFTVQKTASGYGSAGIRLSELSAVKSMISWCSSTERYGIGITVGMGGVTSYSLSIGWDLGFYVGNYSINTWANNTAAKNNVGFGFYLSPSNVWVYNCVSIANTTNWGAYTSGAYSMRNNAGLSTDAIPDTVGGTAIYVTTADFVGSENNDFRIATGSDLIDAGVEYYGILGYDIADAEVPNYNNGGTEAIDVGCYEYDHGYGPHPATIDLTLTGVIAGSEVRIYAISDGAELAGTESCVSNPTFTFTANVQVRILVISTIYRLIDFVYSAGSGTASIPIEMSEDPWFKDPV